MSDEYKITNKFASKCITCGNIIEVGEQVFWKKGSGIWHITPCEETEALQPDNSALIIISDEEWKDFKQYELKYLRTIKNCQRCGTDVSINKDSWFSSDRRVCESCSTV